VEICTGYQDGVDPGRDGFDDARPVYEPIAGWGDPTWAARVSQARTLADLPSPVRAYLDLIAETTQVPITMVSVGADREQTIHVTAAF
jgi:adenylosuccinate synthase